MKAWIRTLLPCLLLMLTSFTGVPNNPTYDFLQEKATVYEEKVSILSSEVNNLNTQVCEMENRLVGYEIADLKASERKKRVRKVSYSGYSKVEGNIPGTRFYLVQPRWIKLNPSLQRALEEYSGPIAYVTSINRSWPSKSLHTKGRAVDIKPSKDVTLWLVSEEGANWRERHSIQMYIEDSYRSKELTALSQLDEKVSEFILINKGATGSHIHLGCRDRKKT